MSRKSLLADAPDPTTKKVGPACWYELLVDRLDAKDLAKVDGWIAGPARDSDLAEHLTTVLAPLLPLGGRKRISADAVRRHRCTVLPDRQGRSCRCGQA